MKRIFMIMTLLTSSSSFALTCTSEEDPSKKLQLVELGSNKISGQLIEKKLSSVYAGTKESNFSQVNYDLYDQSGQVVEFSLLKMPPSTGGHCRARVCPSHFPSKTSQSGKLVIKGEADEYFTCI
jgi:hypothetical protein